MKTLKQLSDEHHIPVNTLLNRAISRGIGTPPIKGEFYRWLFSTQEEKELLKPGKKGRRWSKDPKLRTRKNK